MVDGIRNRTTTDQDVFDRIVRPAPQARNQFLGGLPAGFVIVVLAIRRREFRHSANPRVVDAKTICTVLRRKKTGRTT